MSVQQKAWEDGKFDNEVVPVSVPQQESPIIVSKDEELHR
jgi:acetyl-CoA C-acetyltransferase